MSSWCTAVFTLVRALVGNVPDMSWTCPGLVHLSLFLASTAIPQGHWVTWLLWVPCPKLKSHNLSHEQFDCTKSENYCTKCKYFVQQCLCTIPECIEVAQLHCIGTYFMLFCMFWCCLYLAYVLSTLCPVIWCPCPEMITHYWCNVQDASRPCPGHVLDMSKKLSIWSFFGHALRGHLQLRSCVQTNVLDILSGDVGLDLPCILQQVSKKGFMSNEDGGMMFSFAHDKIQQAGQWIPYE